MDTYDILLKRRSVRDFIDKEIPLDILAKICEAGLNAPCAGNLQNYKLILVRNKSKIRALAEASMEQYWMENAYAIIIVVDQPKFSRDFYGMRGERLYSIQNCAAVAENIIIAAESFNIGSCWVSAFDEEAVKNILGIPPENRPQVLIPLGYAKETPLKPQKYPIEVMIYLEKWGGKIENVMSFLGFYSAAINQHLSQTKEKIKLKAKELKQQSKKLTKEFVKKLKELKKK